MKRISTALLILSVVALASGCSVAYGAAPVETAYGATVLEAEPLAAVVTPPAPPLPKKPESAPPAETISEPEETEIPEAEKPAIAITFDDGPSREITPQLVEVLEEYGVKATFCIVGNRLKSNMEIGKMIHESGSELIGHSWNHSFLTKLSADAIKTQLLDTNALIEEITGYTPVFYRPPYGAVNTRVKSVSEELGLSLLMWSIDPRDWKTKDAELTYEHVLENVKEGSIILCHDLYESTLEAVKMLIPELLDRGYRFVTISELFTETEPAKLYYSAPLTVDA